MASDLERLDRQNRELRTRLAEVEAELASEAEAHRHSAAGRAVAEARLAAVEALCDKTDPFHAIEFIAKVRAMARGKAGRG